METKNLQPQQTNPQKWYDNKILLLLLFFLFPPLGIFGMLKHKTASWKKVLYILPCTFFIFLLFSVIIFSFFIDNYKEGISSYNRKDYKTADYFFKLVKPEDAHYEDALAKIAELKPKIDSINTKKEKSKIAKSSDKKVESNKLTSDEIQKLKTFQKKWTDSLVKVENTPINGNHLIGSKTSLPDTILLEYSKGATKEGFDINLEQDTELYRKFYKETVSKKLGKMYADYPVYISPIANKEVISKMDRNTEYTHPALAFRGIDIYKGNSVYKEKIGYIKCVFDDPDKDRFDMYNEIVIVQSKKGIIKIPYAKLRKNYWTTVKENDVTKTIQKCINF